MMLRVVLALSLLISAFFAPWWVAAAFAVLLIGWYPDLPSAALLLLAGIIRDSIFGAPLLSLGGFSYLFTALFLLLSCLALVLRNTLSE